MAVKTAYKAEGRDEFANLAFQDYWVKYVIPYDELASNLYNIIVPAETYLLDVMAIVTEAFDAATTLDIGVEGNTDAFIDSSNSDVDPATLNSHNKTSSIPANVQGDWFPSAAAVIVTLTPNTTHSKGELTVLVKLLKFEENWRSLQDITG